MWETQRSKPNLTPIVKPYTWFYQIRDSDTTVQSNSKAAKLPRQIFSYIYSQRTSSRDSVLLGTMEEESNDTFFEFTNDTVFYNNNESFPNDTFWPNATYPPYLGAYTTLFMLEYSVPVLTVATLTVLLGTTGNVLVIFSVCRYRRLRSSISYYLVSLSTADLFLCCVFTPLKTAEYFLPEWPFGAVMCKAVAYIHLLVMSSSVLTLTAIAYER
ncbi:hypothetical protein Bbelb_129170 [Branchiostoma belcheri]|nr:hypothetical protein Bbelb_129170 [Branchiostoma belcheri]